MGSSEQSPADLTPSRITVRMENPRAAVRRLARESQLRAGAIELRAPFNQLRDVLGAFLDQKSDRILSAQPIPCVDGVLLMQADFVFVAECHGYSALRPRRRRVAQI